MRLSIFYWTLLAVAAAATVWDRWPQTRRGRYEEPPPAWRPIGAPLLVYLLLLILGLTVFNR
ncbi:MAG TPA: hypothetical protein VLN57_13485 [Xanthobacteraceae bacterium]|nr:hypothetical protein [Xanthobacteraceae bacterium]